MSDLGLRSGSWEIVPVRPPLGLHKRSFASSRGFDLLDPRAFCPPHQTELLSLLSVPQPPPRGGSNDVSTSSQPRRRPELPGTLRVRTKLLTVPAVWSDPRRPRAPAAAWPSTAGSSFSSGVPGPLLPWRWATCR